MKDAGARAQAIRGTPPRDHLPLLLDLVYRKHSLDPEEDQHAKPKCNPTATMNAVTHAFLQDAAKGLLENEARFAELAEAGAPDGYVELLVDAMLKAGNSTAPTTHTRALT